MTKRATASKVILMATYRPKQESQAALIAKDARNNRAGIFAFIPPIGAIQYGMWEVTPHDALRLLKALAALTRDLTEVAQGNLGDSGCGIGCVTEWENR